MSSLHRPPTPRADPGAPSVDPARSAAVAAGLRDYLRSRLGIPDLHYEYAPKELSGGCEAYTYYFRLRKAPDLPPDFDRPLVLRVYASRHALARARHEFAVQRHLRRLDYPVPEPLWLDEDCGLFGGPFLIAQEVRGETLFDALLDWPWRICVEPERLAVLHARLHALPAEGFPAPPGPFLPRRLHELETTLRDHDLAGLRPGMDWLRRHPPAPPAVPSILHLDFHPFNVLETDDDSLFVLDWNEADVGDPHADVAVALTLMQCFPVRPSNLLEVPVLWIGRFLLREFYLQAYRGRRALDPDKLAYYQSWAALRRLSAYGVWLRASPHAAGYKPSSVWQLTPAHIRDLCEYFRKWTGVRVHL